MPSTDEKRATFRQLHQSGCFVIPNPWDSGSARYLASLGFPALATTSAGAAWSMGYADGDAPLDQVLAHIQTIVEATDLPVNADFESGFADTAEGVAESVRRCVATGVAGLSIEDFTGDRSDPLYELPVAVERIRAARAAIDAHGPGTMLVGRSEGFFRGRPDLEDTIRRLIAYAEGGANCLYAPGISTREQIETIVREVAPLPVNVLISRPTEYTVADLAAMGVRRISLGGVLAAAAWGGFSSIARQIAEHGSFAGLANAAPGVDFNALFRG